MSTQEFVLFLNGKAGKLESLYFEQANAKANILLCHPHPLYDGTMHNKVITTLQRLGRDTGNNTLRFNFRGVGKSGGEYADGEGEIFDAKVAVEYLLHRQANLPLIICGFSFGSCVAACLTQLLEKQNTQIKQLIMIAPPLERFNIFGREPQTTPLLIIQPEQDEVVNPQKTYDWSTTLNREHTLLTVPQCSHFFHGHLNELKELVTPYFQ